LVKNLKVSVGKELVAVGTVKRLNPGGWLTGSFTNTAAFLAKQWTGHSVVKIGAKKKQI
jgi:TPP-dependent pyruvate/acetoin dehydrogenase alpha subunit